MDQKLQLWEKENTVTLDGSESYKAEMEEYKQNKEDYVIIIDYYHQSSSLEQKYRVLEQLKEMGE